MFLTISSRSKEETVLYCNAPVVPPYATIGNLRLSYKPGDRLNVTCDVGGEPVTLECVDGLWTGQNAVCNSPAQACSPPNIHPISYVEGVKPRYKNGDQVNITCNDHSDQFVWECQEDGLWRERNIKCAFNVTPVAGDCTNRGYGLASKEALSEKVRGPLPDVPEGFANYVADEQSLYVEPYLKQNGDPSSSYEVYE
nr:uncharacterized protein LOC129282849 [Lytechinus pictus]